MASIRGIVRNKNSQKPIKDALVYVNTSGFPDWRGQNASSDESGHFELRDLPPGVYTLRAQTESVTAGRVRYPFFGSVEGVTLSVSDIECNINVDVRGILHGRVQDATDGSPIRGATVDTVQETGGLFKAVTQEDGEYNLGQIIPQTYRITCAALGYAAVQQHAYIGDALERGPVTLPFFLMPLPSNMLPEVGIVRGFVFNEMGNPLVGAEVTLTGEGHQRTTTTFKNYFDYQTGNYEFPDIKPGQYAISVTRSGMQPARIEMEVMNGRNNWAPNITLQSLPITIPPEIEYLRIEPRLLTVGQRLDIRLRIKGPIGHVASASANLWGTGGLSLGFALDRNTVSGELVRTFDRWTEPGRFVLSQVMIYDTETGKAFTVPVHAQFEVLPQEQPTLTPDSSIFKVPR